MEIRFKNEKEREFYENFKALKRRFNVKMAKKIVQRIDDLEASYTPQHLPQSARWHEHQGRRKGLFSVDLVHPFHFIVRPIGDYDSYIDIKVVEIYEVFNSHK